MIISGLINLKVLFHIFKKPEINQDYEHRGGWNSILNYFKQNSFYNDNSDILFFDLLEHYFLWDTKYYCNNKWAGIIHCTPKTPSYLNNININGLFSNKNFINSLNNCFLLITTSKYIKKYLLGELKKIKYSC